MLEQKAQQLAAEAEQDKPKLKDKILFVRSDPFLLAFYFISSQHHTWTSSETPHTRCALKINFASFFTLCVCVCVYGAGVTPLAVNWLNSPNRPIQTRLTLTMTKRTEMEMENRTVSSPALFHNQRKPQDVSRAVLILSLSGLLSRSAARAEKRPYSCVWRTEGRLNGLW